LLIEFARSFRSNSISRLTRAVFFKRVALLAAQRLERRDER
jgi:hypothetical protein